jgi:hypothetical protein
MTGKATRRGGLAPPPALPAPALSAHMAIGCADAAGGNAMEGKAKYIFPVIITGVIVFVVSAVVTFTNIGLRVDFVPRWLKAFATGWPVAALTAFVAFPHARRITTAVERLFETKT